MFQLFDEKRQRRYALTGKVKEIGRARECDICLTGDDKTSRIHARLDWDGCGWNVRDLDSTNGLYVNGTQVKASKLRPGDTIKIGRTTFRFLPYDTGSFELDDSTVM